MNRRDQSKRTSGKSDKKGFEGKKYSRRDDDGKKEYTGKKEFRGKKDSDDRKEYKGKKEYEGKKEFRGKKEFDDKKDFKGKKEYDGNKTYKSAPKFKDERFKKKKGDPLPSFSNEVRLNKYIANAGICSRREADVLIQTGVVEVNGKVITELGFKVKPTDEVKYDGAVIRGEIKRYVLLNKPKDFITTMSDPQGRRTAYSLVKNACKERIYPVGRLDRNTTGLLLFTNDGDMAKRLTHPRYEVSKLYYVELNKPISKEYTEQLLSGVELDDGSYVKADKAEIVKDSGNREVGIELHSGKNRVVRRMFESIGFEVIRLDRVMFAGLTKRDLPRGHWRHLSDKEVSFLKMI